MNTRFHRTAALLFAAALALSASTPGKADAQEKQAHKASIQKFFDKHAASHPGKPLKRITGTKPGDKTFHTVQNATRWAGPIAQIPTHTGSGGYQYKPYASKIWTSFYVPSAYPVSPCVTDAEMSYWAGIDGGNGAPTSTSVEQTGFTMRCVSGSPVYSVWYENYPTEQQTISMSISPGDVFEFFVEVFPVYNGLVNVGGVWTPSYSGANWYGVAYNVTQSEIYYNDDPYYNSNSISDTAEVVAERGAVFGGLGDWTPVMGIAGNWLGSGSVFTGIESNVVEFDSDLYNFFYSGPLMSSSLDWRMTKINPGGTNMLMDVHGLYDSWPGFTDAKSFGFYFVAAQ